MEEGFANALYLAFYELSPGEWRDAMAQLAWVIVCDNFIMCRTTLSKDPH